MVFILLSKTLLRSGYLGMEYVQSTAIDLHNIRQNYLHPQTSKLIHSTVMEYYNRFLMAVERLPTAAQNHLVIPMVFFQKLSPDTMQVLSFEVGMAPLPRLPNEEIQGSTTSLVNLRCGGLF